MNSHFPFRGIKMAQALHVKQWNPFLHRAVCLALGPALIDLCDVTKPRSQPSVLSLLRQQTSPSWEVCPMLREAYGDREAQPTHVTGHMTDTSSIQPGRA